MSSQSDTAATHSRKVELDAGLAEYSIGGAINALRAYPTAISVLVDIAEGGYMSGMPEEITAEIKAALDLAKGGDGRIYRAEYARGAAQMVRVGKRELPAHIARLEAPLQVWDYIWWLQDRVAELESQIAAARQEVDRVLD